MINGLLIYENSQIRPVHRQMQERDKMGARSPSLDIMCDGEFGQFPIVAIS